MKIATGIKGATYHVAKGVEYKEKEVGAKFANLGHFSMKGFEQDRQF